MFDAWSGVSRTSRWSLVRHRHDGAPVTVEEREFLLQSLRDLEHEREAGDIDEADYLALKEDYTARAAAALRDEAPVEAAPGRPRPRRWRAVLVTVCVLAAGALAGELLARSSGERVAGESATGSIRQTSSSDLARARALFDDGKLVDALKLFDGVLRNDPENVMALSYRGYIVALAGLTDQGMTSIDKAIRLDPKYPFAHFFKGLVLLNVKKDTAGGIGELQAFLDNDPPPAMRDVVQGMIDAAAKVPTGVTTTTGP
jgi:tetratricopeptide (TPR) repeat protein